MIATRWTRGPSGLKERRQILKDNNNKIIFNLSPLVNADPL